MFIARIARGRTIREFMVGVMSVPTTIGFFWLCIFGGNGTAGVIEMVRNWNLPGALFGTIERMIDVGWVTRIMSALATFLLATWFITSSDSGTLVITTMLSMGGDDPPQRFRIVWGMGEGLVAAALPVSVVLLLILSLSEDSSAVPTASGSPAPVPSGAE